MRPSKFRSLLFYITLVCILTNFLVKLGIIWGFEYKSLLVFGSIIDALGVTIIACIGRYK